MVKFKSGHSYRAADAERRLTPCYSDQHVRPRFQTFPFLSYMSRYQATSIADIEFAVGYLAAILTVSAQCLMPRAKFMKIVFFSVLSTCGGAALSCLVVLCSVRARQHTTPANASQSVREGYNSSASVVSAIWLFFSI